jgi:cytochrome b
MPEKMESIRVWDPVVRVGHWLLVAGFFTAYLTEDDFLTQHVWAGYVVGAVILVRVLWGFIGTKHARFRDFVYSPRAIIRYLGGLSQKRAPRYVGHNPAGGVMILALLLSLVITTVSGLMVYAYEENAGPLNTWVHETTTESSAAITEGHGDSDEAARDFEEAEEFWEELHEFFANFTLLLVLLHIGGVLISSVAHKENLVKAMFTGKKRAE